VTEYEGRTRRKEYEGWNEGRNTKEGKDGKGERKEGNHTSVQQVAVVIADLVHGVRVNLGLGREAVQRVLPDLKTIITKIHNNNNQHKNTNNNSNDDDNINNDNNNKIVTPT
jgi:hypothetical protein